MSRLTSIGRGAFIGRTAQPRCSYAFNIWRATFEHISRREKSMETLFRDLRHCVGMLFRRPGFTFTAVITLALGIGANSAIFTVLNAVMLRPLPYPEANRLVQISETRSHQKNREDSVSPHNFIDWRDQSWRFEQIAAYRYLAFNFTDGYRPERIAGAGVSASFFKVLGVTPQLGRDFHEEDDAPGMNRVAILSDGLWHRRFGSFTEIIGRAITLNGESYKIIGIAPREFRFPASAELWTPLGIDLNRVARGDHFLRVIGRLRTGTALQSAQSEMDAIAYRIQQQFPNTNAGRGVNLVGLHEQMVGRVRPIFFVLLSAVGLLLTVAMVNVANLQLAHAAARQKEFAIKLALGSNRRRLIQQCLVESLLLALAGGGLGLLVAFWGTGALVSSIAAHLPRANEIRVDGWALFFTLTVSLATGLLSGLAPTLNLLNTDLNDSLKEGERGTTNRNRRLHDLFVISEVALAVVLLIGAGLLIKSLYRLQRVDPGFSQQGTITAQISLPDGQYGEGQLQADFFRRVIERLGAIPEVQYAGAVSDLPFSGSRTNGTFEIENRPPAAPGESLNADLRIVTPNYFKAMGIPLLEGRDFASSDGRQAPGVAIVNRSLARLYWPDENPIGRRLIVGTPEERAYYGGPIWRQIVGIAGDVKHENLRAEATPEIYVPHLQSPTPRMSLVVRGRSDPSSMAALTGSAVQSMDPEQPLYNVRNMGERVAQSVSTQRMNAFLLAVFATIALCLAAVGIYGVVSYTVTQRTHEIGIRMALGAQPRDVLRLVIKYGMRVTLIGVGIGMIAAVVLTRFISSLIFGISPADPLTFLGVAALLGATAFLACYVPVRRAVRIDLLKTLRSD
jgi:putative ABC transport system permease protein